MKINKHNNYIRKWYGKILHIWEPTHRINFYYIRAKTWEEYCLIFRNRFNMQKGNTADGKFSVLERNGEQVGVIWANDEINLAHECLHGVFWLMQERGIDLCQQTEEVFCYLQGFLLRTILNK